MNYDELRPLRWRHFHGAPGWQVWAASTPVAEYQVVQWEHRFRWTYSGYFQSRSIECESVNAGIQASWDHWKNLVRQIVEPHPMDGTTIATTPYEPKASGQ
ncbi:MAG: hypothetical protein JNG89_01890 [Planctomycetaceae bacterium]|nr:hypothetical protein [Planctomycetaceae bacterium]